MTPAEVFSLRSLWDATRRAARHKRSGPTVARFLLSLEAQLVSLRDELIADTWQPSRPTLLDVRDPKPRVISVLPFRDRVVHQCLWAVLSPRIERRLIADTYASREGHGTHAALRRARSWARTWRWYVHLDVARYFPSIDHAIVREHLRRDVPEPWLRALCDRILRAGVTSTQRWYFPGDDLFSPFERAVGLPLGNLTSQLWANRYLDPVDHHMKDRLRVRGYLRYMDDMLLFHDDRAALDDLARVVESRCADLRLRLHPWAVMPTRAGVGFVGYRVLPDHVRVRRTTVARAERRLVRAVSLAERGALPWEDVWDGLRSTFGHWSHADAWRLKERTLRRLGRLYEPDLDTAP